LKSKNQGFHALARTALFERGKFSMELYVFDANRQPAGVVESFEYLRWTRRYAQCGSFELKAIATAENLALLTLGNILWKSGGEEAGVIEYAEISQDEKELITVSGRFAVSYLARRIVWDTEILNGTLADCVGQLLDNHLINPGNTDRRMDFLDYDGGGLSDPVSTQISYKNLMDAVAGLCEAADAGIKAVFSPQSRTFTIQLYKGAASQAVFSWEYENLTSQTFTKSASDYANVALIGGEGEGLERVFAVYGESEGAERREVFVDAKALRSEDFGDEYTAALLFQGQSKLSELAMAQSFDASVNPHGNLTYGTDFDLGQTVKVVSKKWGVTLTTRITEIEESYDSTGQSLDITFGKGVLTLSQKLKGAM
jgi:hypothetical protein